MRPVTFRNRDIEIVGDLHLPNDFRESGLFYYKSEYVDPAVDRLAAFYARLLG